VQVSLCCLWICVVLSAFGVLSVEKKFWRSIWWWHVF
jgi:hypothetical protein